MVMKKMVLSERMRVWSIKCVRNSQIMKRAAGAKIAALFSLPMATVAEINSFMGSKLACGKVCAPGSRGITVAASPGDALSFGPLASFDKLSRRLKINRTMALPANPTATTVTTKATLLEVMMEWMEKCVRNSQPTNKAAIAKMATHTTVSTRKEC